MGNIFTADGWFFYYTNSGALLMGSYRTYSNICCIHDYDSSFSRFYGFGNSKNKINRIFTIIQINITFKLIDYINK